MRLSYRMKKIITRIPMSRSKHPTFITTNPNHITPHPLRASAGSQPRRNTPTIPIAHFYDPPRCCHPTAHARTRPLIPHMIVVNVLLAIVSEIASKASPHHSMHAAKEVTDVPRIPRHFRHCRRRRWSKGRNPLNAVVHQVLLNALNREGP